MNKKISVLVPAFNDISYIKSLLKKFPFSNDNFELIILDDSNNDLIEDYLKNKSDLFKFVYIKNPFNKGAVATWNELLNHAKGDFIWLLHQNDFPSNFQSIFDNVSSTEKIDAFIIPAHVENKFFGSFRIVRNILIKLC